MKMRTTLSALVLAGAAALAASAQADTIVFDGTTSPPQVVDVIPSHPPAYPHTSGRYVWNGTRYVWIGGYAAPADDAYGRWSWVPNDFVDRPEMFLRPDDMNKG